jgi:hypothetical protein
MRPRADDQEKAMWGDLLARVAIYERRLARGEILAHDHHDLTMRVASIAGPDAAEFFREEHRLPLVERGLPWPMNPGVAFHFSLWRAVSSCVGFVVASGVAGLPLWPGGVLSGLAGALATYGLVTLAPKLAPPRDIEERGRLVRAFQQIKGRG